MVKTKFTTENEKIYDLTLDLARGDFSLHIDKDKVSKKDLESYLRDKINGDILKGATLFQAFRRNNLVIYEIVEEIVNTTIGENIFNSPFVENFVEVKNRALGDTTSFYTEGGLLTVSRFAGNHWDTNRQAIDLGSEITLPKEWIYIHVYDELERFLTGITSIDKLLDVVYKSVNKYIKDRIYTQFQSVANAFPSDFSMTGNSEEAVGKLCDKVQAAGGYESLAIAGTKGALRKLTNIVPDKMFADSQKEAKALTGSIDVWEGNRLMVIPQTLKSGTFDLALDDTKLFILGGDTKPIKLEWFGDTRSDIGTGTIDGSKRNSDATIDVQVQTLMGMGFVLPAYAGLFTFS